jgi:hypothetical protein
MVSLPYSNRHFRHLDTLQAVDRQLIQDTADFSAFYAIVGIATSTICRSRKSERNDVPTLLLVEDSANNRSGPRKHSATPYTKLYGGHGPKITHRHA